MMIVCCVISLHHGFCKSVDTFLQDFSMVLNSTGDACSPPRNNSNVKEILAEAIDVHATSTRYVFRKS